MVKQFEFDLFHQEPQIIASNPNYSVFLSASAGTGKTKVLCDRFLNLVIEGVDPTKIMCITFTNSAAAEMLERIINISLVMDNKDHKKISEKILFNKHYLKIKTIHAFCLEILTSYYKMYGGQSKKLIDNSVKQQAIKNLFKNLFKNFLELDSEINKSFIELNEHFPNSEIEKRINYIVNKSSDFEQYLSKYKTGLESHIYKLHQVDTKFDYNSEQYKFLVNWESTVLTKLSDIEKIDKNAALILTALNESDYIKLKEILLTKDGEIRKLFHSKKVKQIAPLLNEIIIELQNKVIIIEQSYKNYVFAKLNIAFIKLSRFVVDEYKTFKEQNYYIDYDDIISEVLNLMELDPGILYNLDYKIDHILIDEAQDLSEKQWKLIYLLSDEFFAGLGAQERLRTLFIVGDFKQSIFSFQGANPALFLNTANRFLSKINNNELWKEIEMSKSFRSELNILKLVNNIFPTFFENFSLHDSHKLGLGHVEIWPLIICNSAKSEKKWSLPNLELSEESEEILLAEFIAEKVFQWISSNRIIGDKIIRPKDIMILVRKRSKYIDILTAKLRSRNLRVTTPKYSNFIDDLIIMDLMAIGNFLLCPDDDLNLTALLKSPFFNMSDTELTELCCGRQGSLINTLSQSKPYLSSKLAEIRKIFTKLSLSLAYYETLFDYEYYHNFCKRFGNKARLSIDSFLEAVNKFEESNQSGGIESLLKYLEYYENDTNYQFDEDSIRIMTVHSAKGLQAPIVIMADATSSETNQLDDVSFINGELYFSAGSDYKSTKFEHIKNDIKKLQEEESKRLLYVAVTRAESELYVAGVKGNKFENSWYNIIKNYSDKSMLRDYKYGNFSKTLTKNVVEISYNKNKKISEKIKYNFKSLAVLEGDIIHNILQQKSELNQSSLISYLDILKLKYRAYFNASQIDKFYEEAQMVWESFPKFFLPNSYNEQAVISNFIDPTIYRMDKIIFRNNEILILDFKTDYDPPPDINEIRTEYLLQIRNYIKIMKQLYPTYLVEGIILWTKIPSIMTIK